MHAQNLCILYAFYYHKSLQIRANIELTVLKPSCIPSLSIYFVCISHKVASCTIEPVIYQLTEMSCSEIWQTNFIVRYDVTTGQRVRVSCRTISFCLICKFIIWAFNIHQRQVRHSSLRRTASQGRLKEDKKVTKNGNSSTDPRTYICNLKFTRTSSSCI